MEKERDELRRKLKNLRERHANEEGADKQKKSQAVNYLEDTLREYDTAMIEKHQQHEGHKLANDRVETRMAEMQARVLMLKAERLEFEERERIRSILELGQTMRQTRLTVASDVIQNWWKPQFEAKNKKGKKGKKK